MGVHDRRVLMIIKKMLKAGVLNEITRTELGTPQGGIVSPLLANVYLHKLDQAIIREWEGKKTKYKYKTDGSKIKELKKTNLKPAYLIRYADDWTLVTDTQSNAEKWKKRLEKFLDTKLKLKLSPEKTLITNIRKKNVHFLGFQFKQVPGRSKRGWITRTKPDDMRLRIKVDELRKDLKQLKKCSGAELVNKINVVNSKMVGLGNYYQAATMVNLEFIKYAESLMITAYLAIQDKGGQWAPANQTGNLINRHESYTTKIPTIKYKGTTVGITSLGFAKWERVQLKNPSETPYTAEGRKTYFERTMKQRRLLPRDDITMNLSLYKYEGQTNGIYNFEFLMNRAYAFNRDKSRCRICGEIIIGDELVTHHINPNLPLYRVNKVPNLASTHQACHNLIHGAQDAKHLGSKIKQKILRFREKLK